jgi:hypothetical protein
MVNVPFFRPFFPVAPSQQFNQTHTSRWRKDDNVNCIRYTTTGGHPEVLEFLRRLPH